MRRISEPDFATGLQLTHQTLVAQPAAEIGGLAEMVGFVDGHEADDAADLAVEAGRARSGGLGQQILRDIFKRGGQRVAGLAPGAEQRFGRRVGGVFQELFAAPKDFKRRLRPLDADEMEDRATTIGHVAHDPRHVIQLLIRALEPFFG